MRAREARSRPVHLGSRPCCSAMRRKRDGLAAMLAVLALGGGVAVQFAAVPLLDDGGIVAIVASLVVLAITVPRIVSGGGTGRRIGGS